MPHNSPVALLAPIRAKGVLLCRYDENSLQDLREEGGYRLKFPLNDAINEVIIVNTGGGLVGGDRLDIGFSLNNSSLMVSNTGAEKIYDAKGLESILLLDFKLQNAELMWLPQETMLFNGGALKRDFTLACDKSSRFMLCEMMVFGRIHAQEIITQASLHDKWRIYVENKLLHAEQITFTGALHEKLNHPAIGDGARAMGTLLAYLPDIEAKCEALRALNLEDTAFSIKNGLLIARILTKDAEILRLSMAQIIGILTKINLPRTW